ncbi:hypothetical protein niasHT_027306 [Heterodera trifolii]|uniref:Uncharacterized protein n=1 Tax=Heterodera trifolii TaxID=157864 RepID=A0ABD2JTR1_9BILA
MSSKCAKMARSDNVFLAIAAQRANEKQSAYKEAELNMLSWINQLFSRQVIQHFNSKNIAYWMRLVDLHSQTMSRRERFLRSWGPLALSQGVMNALVPKLDTLSQRKTRKRLTEKPLPYKIREQMMQLEKQRQIANAFVACDDANANSAAISAPNGGRRRHKSSNDDGATTAVVAHCQTVAEEQKDDTITPGAEVSAVRRRLARVLVSPDYLMQLFRRHSVDEFTRVVTGLYVQYERFDCPKPRVTIARVQCISFVEQKAPSRVDGMAPAKTETEAREWQRVRLHVSRGDVLTIAQCQSPLNQCRFPFLLDFGTTEGIGTDRSTLALPLNPSSDEIERKARELHTALISKV